jgi:uncharacterized protein YggE
MRRVILLMVALNTLLISFDMKMSQEFSLSIDPKELSMRVDVRTLKKSSNETTTTLTTYSDFIGSYSGLTIKGGNFNIRPEYRYLDKKRRHIGYRGSVYYLVKSSSTKALSTFISALSSRVDGDKDTDLSISSSSWRVDEEALKRVKNRLNMKAIKWAKEYQKRLSTTTSMECTLKSIDFQNTNLLHPPIIYSSDAKVDRGTNIPIPKKESRNIKIKPKFEFECS